MIERAHDDETRIGKFMSQHITETSDDWEGVEEHFAALLAEVRADERERCAQAIEADGKRVEREGVTLGEACKYNICALIVRQASPVQSVDGGPK